MIGLTGGRHDAAVPMVGVLVHAQVGDEHELVAHLPAQVLERELDDPPRVPRAGALRVLAGGDAEEDDPGHAEGRQLADLLAERLAGVLDDAGEAGDRLRLTEAGATVEYELLPLGKLPAAESMPGGYRWKVHTKKVET